MKINCLRKPRGNSLERRLRLAEENGGRSEGRGKEAYLESILSFEGNRKEAPGGEYLLSHGGYGLC